MATELFTNEAATTVSSGGTGAPAQGTVESWTVASSSSFPAISGGQQFHVGDPAAVTEIIAVTAVSGTTWTVTRGAESTTPVTHASGFTVQQVITGGTLGTFAQAGAGDVGGTGAAPTVVSTHLSAALPIAQGGTGQSAQQAAIDALAGAVTSGQVLRGNGTHVQLAALQAADIPAIAESQVTGLVSDLAARAQLAGAAFTGYLAPAVFALTDGATITVDASKGNVFTVTLGGYRTLASPTNPVAGQAIRFHVTQDGTGSRTLSYGAAYDFGTAGTPTLTTTAGKMDILGFAYDGGLAKWCYLGSGPGF